ncbi:acyl-CoA dehydrogenase/oxidase [Thelonectria olida]|uniref:Acyl-CoA dehydrogenase/oxidase n=1 Tax=Thelonectria olida TaxID=1576542 RepID=A0A9P9AHF2_9HYPO|nr:acyl-CoA dehydrogenase/oxidase [Thelonectria olida]
MSSPSVTREEVARHNTPEDLWCIIDHKVYDLTDFADAHPGGNVVLEQVAGQDATTAFYNLHRHEVLQKYADLCISTLENEAPEVLNPKPGDLSPVPYAEPLWLRPEFSSPHYTESHHRLQQAMRRFVDIYVIPEAQEKERDGTYVSQELVERMAKENIHAMRLGPGEHLHGRTLLGGVVEGKDFDFFHELVVSQELARIGARGFADGMLSGLVIGLTAVIHWLPHGELRTIVIHEALAGKKKICLAISEAFAGSDVAGIQTTATKTTDGKHYVVSGTKKWITNGMFADYFVTGCKTDKGFSVLLIPRSEGVTTKAIKTSYSATAGTAYVQFDKVMVPVDHLLGEEHKGFTVIMSNFNHERFAMICGSIRGTRGIVEECLKWCNQRVVFKRRLIDQPVIRAKLARMIANVEAAQAWLEQITGQMVKMAYKEQAMRLSGPLALLKSFTTRVAHEVADEAVNIFGGRGLTQTGMGSRIENFQRTYKFDAILGGAEEILSDLAVRQAVKKFPKSML